MLLNIIYLFIVDRLNLIQISKKLSNLKSKIIYWTICSILNIIRYCITTYLKQIGGDPLQLKTRAIENSLFLYDDMVAQIWVVGEIDTEVQEFRFDLMKKRNSTNLKTLVYNLIETWSHLIHYAWRGFRLLDSNDSAYTLEDHNQGAGNLDKVVIDPHILNRLGDGLYLKLNIYIKYCHIIIIFFILERRIYLHEIKWKLIKKKGAFGKF